MRFYLSRELRGHGVQYYFRLGVWGRAHKMSGARRTWIAPLGLAAFFLAIPPLIFSLRPIPFWTAGEPEMIGLGNALNLAYRLADLKMYSAIGMWDHPGVPFYVMSWLALAFSGLPIAYQGSGFFNAVLERIDVYQAANIWLASIVGAGAVFLFAFYARRMVPFWVVVSGLLIWLVSTPWTLIAFISPTNETFSLLINTLFLLALTGVANDEAFSSRVTILSALVSAFAYLNKLSFINVSLALAFVGLASLFFRRADLRQAARSSFLFAAVSLGFILAIGYFFIGWNEFLHAVRFHKNVVLGSGMYGSGNTSVVDGQHVWDAIRAIPADHVYCIPIALVGGLALIAAGLVGAIVRKADHLPVSLISMGAGLAAVLASLSVLKHYHAHYTPAVSATLPACVVASYLIARSYNYRLRLTWFVGTIAASLLMAWGTLPALRAHIDDKIETNRLATADLNDINALGIDRASSIDFLYSVPSSFYGEGFTLYVACVPRLTQEYHRERPHMFSADAPDSPPRLISAYVIHKGYFPTIERIKTADNLAVFNYRNPVTFEQADQIIELRTSFLLLRGRKAALAGKK